MDDAHRVSAASGRVVTPSPSRAHPHAAASMVRLLIDPPATLPFDVTVGPADLVR